MSGWWAAGGGRSRGCLGCCSKPTEIIGVYESPKGLTIQGRTAMRPSPVEDFWSTSTGEMDNSAVQSQGSISSISTSNQTFDPHSNAGSTSNPPEFLGPFDGHLIAAVSRFRFLPIFLDKPDGSAVPTSILVGLLLWNQTRQQWIGNQKSQNRKQVQEPRIRSETSIDHGWNATYESLLGTNKPLPQPIPLPEMVDFLVDVWEQEGLYD
ncbi:hypothetical protein CK203_080380 [Vitis vinifera]|uniref:Gag1-like clamp domain-containing protein n=1 Tax=Vitis vinifera TaxID=29760 RepID=A0A438F224_VITVI|nr:hypothetical protein CK203_080380 [Vitis vinifera]